MGRTLDQFKTEAAALPPEDRAALAEYLLNSLDDSGADDAAWEEGINRRVAGIRSGKEVGRPAEDVPAEMAAECAQLSEAALAVDWLRPEEDAAWAHLQSAK